MASTFPFSRRTGNAKLSILPLHQSNQPSQAREYDPDELEPRIDDHLPSPDSYDRDSPTRSNVTHLSKAPSSANRKPTGARNRRPSNASSTGSASQTRSRPCDRDPPLFFNGPPPPIAVSKVLYRDEEQRPRYYNDDDGEEDKGMAASWLPGTAARAISSVFKDVRGSPSTRQDHGEVAIAFDRNSVWKSLARRERAVVADVRRFLEILEEESLSQGADEDASISDGAATPTGAASASVVSSRHPGRSVSFLEPESRAGPHGEIIPVRQPRKKKIGINGARRGISRSLAELSNIKAEEDASLAAALSNRKQALFKLRKLATSKQGIVEELKALETDEEEPSTLELEDLDNELRGVCAEIKEVEKHLKVLKNRRRHLEDRMDNVKNQREAGLSGYKNALKEVEDTVKDFLTRPPVKPLDVAALNENNPDDMEQPVSIGGREFMRLLPERRTINMAREWWESEVVVLEARQAYVDKERIALQEGGEMWDEARKIIRECEDHLRKFITEPSVEGKGKGKEISRDESLKLHHNKIIAVVTSLEERLRIAEQNGWKLLETAFGIEHLAYKEASQACEEMLRAVGNEASQACEEMLRAVGNPLDDKLLATPAVPEEDSGTTASHNSFHSISGGQELVDLPNDHEDERVDSDNEVPHDLLATHDQKESDYERGPKLKPSKAQPVNSSFDGQHEDNEIPPEFLAGQLDGSNSDNEVPPELLVEHNDDRK